MWKYRDIFLLGFAVAAGLTPFLRVLAFRFGVLDHPKAHGIHAHPVPRIGGPALCAAFLAAALYRMDLSYMLKGVILSSSMVFAVGLMDDLYRLRASLKLVIQIAACAIMMFGYGVMIRVFNNLWLDAFFTALGVIGITNAVNFLDNMDGLASGLVAIASFAIFTIGYSTRQVWLCYLSAALASACLGFLVHNLRPAHVFMGDCGSTFLGFTLASLCVMTEWSSDKWVTVAAPVLILGVPILDMVLITVLRIKENKVKTFRQWLDYTGKDHLSHRVMRLGLGKRGAVIALWALQGFFSLTAIWVTKQGALAGVLALLGYGFSVFLSLVFFRRKRRVLLHLKGRSPRVKSKPAPARVSL